MRQSARGARLPSHASCNVFSNTRDEVSGSLSVRDHPARGAGKVSRKYEDYARDLSPRRVSLYTALPRRGVSCYNSVGRSFSRVFNFFELLCKSNAIYLDLRKRDTNTLRTSTHETFDVMQRVLSALLLRSRLLQFPVDSSSSWIGTSYGFSLCREHSHSHYLTNSEAVLTNI